MSLRKRLAGLVLAGTVLALSVAPSVSAGAETADTPAVPAAETVTLGHPQFRGGYDTPGITDAKTPRTADEVTLAWTMAFGSGWFSAAGSPVAVGDSLYLLNANTKTIDRVSPETGEVLASGDCPGGSQFFSIIGSGDGLIFVPRSVNSNAVIYAYDAQTLDMVWQSAPIGREGESVQPLCPVIYHDGHIYVGASSGIISGRAEKGAFACFTTADDDPAKTDEVKQPVWTYRPENAAAGYYWSAGAVADGAIAFAGEAGELVLHSLTTDAVYDTLSLGDEAGSVRSAVHYDPTTRRLFATTNHGYLFSVRVNPDHTFDELTLQSIRLGTDITSSPVVYRGRVYVGGGGIQSGDGFAVLDAETLEVIYRIEDVATQSSPVLTTAYATPENGWQVYLYVTQYSRPSGLVCIADKQGQTEPDYAVIGTPETANQNYCTQSVTVDAQGNLYYINDSAKLFAFRHTDPAAGEYTAADVDNAIARLEADGPVQLDDAAAVARVQARFDALDDAQQAAVTKAAALQAMQQRLDTLRDETQQAAEIRAAIAALDPDAVTLEDDDALTALYARFTALSEEGQALVDNADTLRAALARVEALKEAAMADELTAKIAALPAADAVCIDDKAAVAAVRALYDAQSDAVKALVDASRLEELEKRIAAAEKAVANLNARIFEELDPLGITLADKALVQELADAYAAIGEPDRKHVTYYDDVVYARKILAGLEAGRVEADLFGSLYGSDRRYTVEGQAGDAAYSITFDGRDITRPDLAFATGLSFDSPYAAAIRKLAPDAVVLHFAHEGALPGKAQVEVAVNLADGAYTLYAYDPAAGTAEPAGEATVKDGRASFTITHCSAYFLSAAAAPEEQPDETPGAVPGETPDAVPDTGVSFPAAVLLLGLVCAGTLLLVRKQRG